TRWESRESTIRPAAAAETRSAIRSEAVPGIHSAGTAYISIANNINAAKAAWSAHGRIRLPAVIPSRDMPRPKQAECHSQSREIAELVDGSAEGTPSFLPLWLPGGGPR